MASVLTKSRHQKKFLISKGWKLKNAKTFVKEKRKLGYFATTLTKKQDQKIRKLRHITFGKIRNIKRKY